MDSARANIKEEWLAKLRPEARAFFNDFLDGISGIKGLRWFPGERGEHCFFGLRTRNKAQEHLRDNAEGPF